MSVTAVPETNDPVLSMMIPKIVEGINVIEQGNAKVLSEKEDEKGTSVREIDKSLKEVDKIEDAETKKAAAALAKALATVKDARVKARNLYRTNVLNEDPVEDNDVDDEEKKELLDSLRQQRKTVISAVDLVKNYGETNGEQSVVDWINSLQIPQVGRQATSSVGQKKPRAYVFVNDEKFESFGVAAAKVSELLSTEDKHVTFTSPDLVSAWVENGEPETFDFQGLTLKVLPKQSKSESNGKK